MKQAISQKDKPTLESIHQQFKHWRESRVKRSPIPPALWEAAVRLTDEYSVHQVSKTLRLNYNDLKERVKAHHSNGHRVLREGSGFVELDFNAMGLPVAICVMEMEDRAGMKLKVSYQGKPCVDFMALARAFWSEGR